MIYKINFTSNWIKTTDIALDFFMKLLQYKRDARSRLQNRQWIKIYSELNEKMYFLK